MFLRRLKRGDEDGDEGDFCIEDIQEKWALSSIAISVLK